MIEQLFINPSNDSITMIAFNRQTQKRGLYEITDQPKLSHIINSSWYNPDFQSQGLTISKGIRQDDSEYVFLTGYLFRESEPLWVAGVADLIDNPKSLSITLYEYNGLQILQTNQVANQIELGSIDLQLTGCHTLNTKIISPSGID